MLAMTIEISGGMLGRAPESVTTRDLCDLSGALREGVLTRLNPDHLLKNRDVHCDVQGDVQGAEKKTYPNEKTYVFTATYEGRPKSSIRLKESNLDAELLDLVDLFLYPDPQDLKPQQSGCD